MNGIDIIFRGNAASAVAAEKETEAAVGGVGRKTEEAAHKGSGLTTMFHGAKEQAFEFAKVFAPVVAALSAAEFAKGAIEGAEKLRKAQDSLNVAIEHTGGHVDTLRPKYDAVAKAAAQYGISQSDATSALAKATLLTGNAEKAQRAYEEALVISKATGRDFSAVLTATAKAQIGVTTGLQRYGIIVDKTAGGQEQFTQIMARFGDQAEANTTASERLHANLENIQTSIGTAVLPAFEALVNAMNTAVVFVQAHWPEIEKTIDAGWAVVQPILAALADVLVGIANVIRDHWSQIEPIVKNVGDAIAKAAAAITSALKLVSDLLHGDWSKAWTDAKALVGNVLGAIKDLLAADLAAWKTVLTAALTPIGKLFSDTFATVKAAIQDAIRDAKTFVKDRLDEIVGFFTNLPTRAANAVVGIGNTLNTGLRNMKSFASGVVDDIASFFASLPGKALNAAKDLGTSFLSGLEAGFSKLKSDLISIVVEPINSVLKLWNNLSIPGFSIKLPSVNIPGVGKVGGESLGWGGFDLPDVGLLPVPKMAAGGIVTAPTVALIGEAGPEAVVPLDGRFGGGVTVNLHFAKGFLVGSKRQIADELAVETANAISRLIPAPRAMA